MVRDERGQTPPVIQQFLVDLLAYNDNLGNRVRPFSFASPPFPAHLVLFLQYSDAYYLTAIMQSLSHALVKVLDAPTSSFEGDVEIEGNENLAPAVKEVERYLSADRLVPSYHNVVTVAGIEVRSFYLVLSACEADVPALQFMLKLTLASLIPEDRMRFFVYTRCVPSCFCSSTR
jgi:transcription initiation factor TFIID subunit 2